MILCFKDSNSQQQVQKVWMTCSPEACHMREQLLYAFRFAFRKDPVLLSRVSL
ncbi:MAG: hypothetical protein GX792_01770 [Bacteroidales bacterium]|nr:hypothetical protein [Bacteroidales bacterium]